MAKRTYQSKDGQTFATHAEAAAHNRELANPVAQAIQGMDTSGTPFTIPSTPAPVTKGQMATSPIYDVGSPLATPGSLGLSYTPDAYGTQIDAATKALIASYGTRAPDEKAVRSSVLKQFQSEIDALDLGAAQARNRITQGYETARNANLGTDAAIQARRGLAGSDFGAARTSNINMDINSRRDSDISMSDQGYNERKASLFTQARTMANDVYNKKLDAYRSGAGATVQYLREKQSLAQTNATSLVKQALLSDIDITKPEFAADLAALAQQVGTTPEVMKQIYLETKAANDAAEAAEQRKRLVEDRAFGLDTAKYNLDVDKENNLNSRESAKLNFDIEKFNMEYALDSRKVDAEIRKIENDIANGGGDGLLSFEEAAKYGVPYGTTKNDLVGVIPGAAEKIAAADTSLSKVTRIKNLITELENSNDLDAATGALGSKINVFSGPKDFIAKFEQLQSLLALDNISALKGTGAISDREFATLTAAATSLRRNVSEKVFRQNLAALKEQFNDSEQKLLNLKNGLQATTSQQNRSEFEAQDGGSEGQDFFRANPVDMNKALASGGLTVDGNQVKGTREKAQPMQPISNTPYLKTLGTITGIDGSKYWKWGLDVDLKKGDKVKAPTGGTILAIKPGNNGGFGNQIRIRTDDGREIWLSHLDRLPPKTAEGQKIRPGQVLALGGNSGNTYSPGGGDGSHLDITMPKPGGGYYTAREVKAYLDNKYV